MKFAFNQGPIKLICLLGFRIFCGSYFVWRSTYTSIQWICNVLLCINKNTHTEREKGIGSERTNSCQGVAINKTKRKNEEGTKQWNCDQSKKTKIVNDFILRNRKRWKNRKQCGQCGKFNAHIHNSNTNTNGPLRWQDIFVYNLKRIA